MKYVSSKKGFDTTDYTLTNTRITVEEFQTMTLNYCHGAKLYGKGLRGATPRWNYSFVDTLPKAYILAGKTTTQEAYDFGKKIIDACYKANRVDFDLLKQAYKDVLKALQAHKVYLPKGTLLPNPTTRKEVWYEDTADADIENLNFYQTDAEMSGVIHLPGIDMYEYNDKLYPTLEAVQSAKDAELRFYCRAFQVNAPEWFISYSNQEVQYLKEEETKTDKKLELSNGDTYNYTKKGKVTVRKAVFAICPTVSGTGKPKYKSDYAGNEVEPVYMKGYETDEGHAPMLQVPDTLRKDARPQKLSTADRQMLMDSVNFFLSLPIEERKNFLADNFEYTADGELVEISPEEKRDRELEMIREAARLNNLRYYANITG